MAEANSEWILAFQRLQETILTAQQNFHKTLLESNQQFFALASQCSSQLAGRLQEIQTTAPVSPVQVAKSELGVSDVTTFKMPDVPAFLLPFSSENQVSPADNGAASDHASIRMIVLNIVSEKTGYPVDVLDLELDIESGLGIDSIKRIEILSKIQESLPQLSSHDPNTLGELNTLGSWIIKIEEIADFCK